MGDNVVERRRVSRALMPPSAAPDGSLAAELQRAIAERGVSIHWLQHALADRGAHVDPATLISWRTGRLVPGPEAQPVLGSLEDVLGLEQGHLASLVATHRNGAGPSPRGTRADAGTATGSGPGSTLLPGIQRALDALGFEGPAGLVESRVTVHLEIDEHGAQRRVTRRSTWVARRAGTQCFPVVTVLPAPVDDRPELVLLEGCSEGPHYTDLAEGVFATSVVLDRPLEVGATARSAHRIELPAGLAGDTSYEHQLREGVDEVELTIEFHPDRLPAAVYAYSVAGPGRRETTRAVPVVGTLVSHVLRDFGPGVLGVRWRW